MVVIRIETPLQDDARELVAELNEALLALTPQEFCSHLSVEQMADGATSVFVARDGDHKAVACGALKRHPGGVGEVKRMYTRPAHRNRGIGGRILGEIMKRAGEDDIARLVLETGDRHPAAWAVYEKAGFARCGPVLDYPDTGWSVFFDLKLDKE